MATQQGRLRLPNSKQKKHPIQIHQLHETHIQIHFMESVAFTIIKHLPSHCQPANKAPTPRSESDLARAQRRAARQARRQEVTSPEADREELSEEEDEPSLALVVVRAARCPIWTFFDSGKSWLAI